ncbi:MAG: hypothetical protein KJ737_11805 [Proteobacteria bacterium]|nr:hypothetical protein [Pseudomonadota bacterium]
MKNVLIVTYFFPPFPAIGSVRLGGLAKYLPQYGWKPIVLTPKLPGKIDPVYHVVETPYEDRILRLERKLNISTKPTGKGGLKRLIFNPKGERRPYIGKMINIAGEVLSYPDGKRSWIPVAVKSAGKLFNTYPIEAMISSSRPESVHLIANQIKKEYHIPWIADFRDLWSNNPYYSYSRIRNSFEKKLERKTLSCADALSITSLPWAEDLATIHGNARVNVIHNGFDPENYPDSRLSKKFTLTYTGVLYDGKRDPELLFMAVKNLIDEGKIVKDDLAIRFYGPLQGWLEEKIGKYHLQDVAIQYGKVARQDAISKQLESQLLLLLNWNDPKERGTYTGKVYEYFAARRPILSIGAPKGVLTDLLDETGAGKYAFDGDGLKNIVLGYYQEFKQRGSVRYTGREERIDEYTHYKMAGKFAKILDQIT